MYTLDVFQKIAEQHGSWAALKDYLTRPEADGGMGLRLSGEGADNSENRFVVLRYEKKAGSLPPPAWWRSVVWDTKTNRPVCVAPPKAESGDFPTGEDAETVRLKTMEDFVDGVMVNVFLTVGADGLQMATRTSLGAKGNFYSKRSFGELFGDALAASGLTGEALAVMMGKPTEEVPALFGSFVLQHPEHRVVARIRSPRVFLIHTGRVFSDGRVEMAEDADEWPVALRSYGVHQYPFTGFNARKDMESFMMSQVAMRGWTWQGLVGKDGNGRRWRVRTTNYKELRGLRGGEAQGVDRFLRLRAEHKVQEYLKHYGEDRDLFWGFEQKLRGATTRVMDAYRSVHITRDKKLADVEWCLQPCVFRLHSYYLGTLREQGEKVRVGHVVDLVNNLPVFEQRRLLVPSSGPSVAVPAAVAAAGVDTAPAGC